MGTTAVAEFFSGHQHRDPRRIRNYRIGGNSSIKAVCRYQLDFIAHYLQIRFARSHHHFRHDFKRSIEFFRRSRGAYILKHLAAQIMQSKSAVTLRTCPVDLRKHLLQRNVAVVCVLEFEQTVEKSHPLALGNSHREEEHQLKIRRTGGDDPIAEKPCRRKFSRNSLFGKRAVIVHSRSEDAHFYRIDHRPVVSDVSEAVPDLIAFESPDRLIAAEQFARSVGKIPALSAHGIADCRSVPDRKEPRFALFEIAAHAGESLTEIDCFLNDLLDKVLSIVRHHLDRDIIGHTYRIERTCSRVHHIRLIHAVEVDLFSSVPDMDIACLRQRGQEFMRGVGGKERRSVFRPFFRLSAHGKASLIHRVETGITVPCFVKMYAVC